MCAILVSSVWVSTLTCTGMHRPKSTHTHIHMPCRTLTYCTYSTLYYVYCALFFCNYGVAGFLTRFRCHGRLRGDPVAMDSPTFPLLCLRKPRSPCAMATMMRRVECCQQMFHHNKVLCLFVVGFLPGKLAAVSMCVCVSACVQMCSCACGVCVCVCLVCSSYKDKNQFRSSNMYHVRRRMYFSSTGTCVCVRESGSSCIGRTAGVANCLISPLYSLLYQIKKRTIIKCFLRVLTGGPFMRSVGSASAHN